MCELHGEVSRPFWLKKMADFALKIAEIGRLKKKITFFEKKLPKNFAMCNLFVTFASSKDNQRVLKHYENK